MENMRFKVGDRVRIKSLDWYNENKDKYGQVFGLGAACFNRNMSCYCGSVLTIDKAFDKGRYRMKEDYSQWIFTDGMIEGLVEESDDFEKMYMELEKRYEEEYSKGEYCHEQSFKWGFQEGYDYAHENEKLEINLKNGYEFRDDNGNVINSQKIIMEKKKKEYPKTYEECCKVLMGTTDFQDFGLVPTKFSTNRSEENSISPEPPHISLINAFYKLLICRDAYWKIAGEEMGMDKPWEPDWNGKLYYLYYNPTNTTGVVRGFTSDGVLAYVVLSFPTEEMRDAFKENFKEEIEICKELL